MDVAEDPRRWTTTNLVGVPAGVLGGVRFNAHAPPLSIAGAREAHQGLFSLLEHSVDARDAAAIFSHYLDLAFGLQPTDAEGDAGNRRWRASYLRLLQGWGMDANGPPGAVLKGWVESRFGLVPSYHKAPLEHFPSPAWIGYLEEKASSRFHNNNIHQQLDLLYEFCQWSLARFRHLGEQPVPMWRGSNHCEDQLVSGALRERRCVLRLNNLVSFSLRREGAECFGDWLLHTRVPQSKLLFYPGLLSHHILGGEGEVLAIGGDYAVETRYA